MRVQNAASREGDEAQRALSEALQEATLVGVFPCASDATLIARVPRCGSCTCLIKRCVCRPQLRAERDDLRLKAFILEAELDTVKNESKTVSEVIQRWCCSLKRDREMLVIHSGKSAESALRLPL